MFAEKFQAEMNREETTFEKKDVPPGRYAATLKTVDDKGMTKNGVDKTSLIFEISMGEYDGQWLWENIVHSDSVLWKAAEIYKALGLQGQPESWEEFDEHLATMVGRVYAVTTKNREANGKTYTNIVKIEA